MTHCKTEGESRIEVAGKLVIFYELTSRMSLPMLCSHFPKALPGFSVAPS